MPSSYPAPRNAVYDSNGNRDYHTDEIVATLRVHDTLGCADDCDHIKALVSQYNQFEVSIAQNRHKAEKEVK